MTSVGRDRCRVGVPVGSRFTHRFGVVRGEGARRFARRFGLDIAVFGGILLLGVALLPVTFTGDQALNMLMGRVIAHGGAPYVDLWDLKYPGIFFFFAGAGALFGFNEVGIHAFELLWMLTLALVVRATAGAYVRNRRLASLAPVLTVGFYYASYSNYLLTQTEELVGLPLLLSLLFVVRGVRGGKRSSRWLFASGLCAGVVVIFKAPYALLPAVFGMLAVVELRREGVNTSAAVKRILPPLVAGMSIPVSATIVYLGLKHALGIAWWTFAVHPREAATETVLNTQRLFDNFLWFLQTFSVPIALAIVGAWERLRRGWDMQTAALVAWMVLGLVLIWIQVISWWEYHYMLLLVPMGLLATQGLETLWSGLTGSMAGRRRRGAVFAVTFALGVLCVPQVNLAARSVGGILHAGHLPLGGASLRSFQAAHDARYADVLDATSFLRDRESVPGSIYAFANPIVYELAGRDPAIPLLAPWFHPTAELWHRMTVELKAASPPYILVSDLAIELIVEYRPSIRSDVDALLSWVEHHYQEVRTSGDSTWYLRRDLATGRQMESGHST